MREEDSNWFSKWEDELPSPEELIPLSQTLITPDLALAFDIRSPADFHQQGQQQQQQRQNQHNSSAPPPPRQLNSTEFESSAADIGRGAGGGDEPARTLKRPRLVWTPQLHKRFVDAVAHLGIKNAVPKTIMQLMSVDGLTRENVASHLQKYRLYLKRMQGLNNGGVSGATAVFGGGLVSSGDPVTDHLFASSPVPPHFLHQTGERPNSQHFMPYMPPAVALHQKQMAEDAAAGGSMLPQYHHHLHRRQMGHFGSPLSGQFEHHFLSRQSQMGGPRINSGIVQIGGFVDDVDPANGQKFLSLFPTGDD
ncbi:hypothetical protein Nepgr_009947 [Nepenthes gracilis]|uniref:HTH myb-type domain-containing protein n=1 Tax=Nepenthes gracilis TaxID=150966 RepID=A0AAD3SBQ6_NEPGR|nr:hypothetical protein Nepgr_009947 [Nepenthes gracilis]